MSTPKELVDTASTIFASHITRASIDPETLTKDCFDFFVQGMLGAISIALYEPEKWAGILAHYRALAKIESSKNAPN